jgi:hypothetical protein
VQGDPHETYRFRWNIHLRCNVGPPAFAADNNLCTAKLQELKDKVTSLPATSENTTMEIRRLLASAEASKRRG